MVKNRHTKRKLRKGKLQRKAAEESLGKERKHRKAAEES